MSEMVENGMTDEEDISAARAIGGLITSTMFRAHEEKPSPRTFFYVWEREALRWLLRYLERKPTGSVGNDWVLTFLELNRDTILSEFGTIDFDLKSFKERQP